MVGLITWKRPSGSEIKTNDRPETIAHCKVMGWKEVKTKKVKSKF